MPTVNVPIYDSFILRDSGSPPLPITGKVTADFATHLAYLKSNPATTATMTIAEAGDGLDGTGTYLPSFTPSAVGDWGVLISYSADGVTRTFTGSYTVVTASQFDPAAALAAQTVTISSPLTTTGTLTIVAGDDYLHADGRAITWDVTGVPSLVGADVAFTVIRAGTVRLTKAVTIVDADSVRLELLDTETGTLFAGRAYTYEVNALIGASNQLLASGKLTVT